MNQEPNINREIFTEAADEYYEFDGAKLEIKKQTSITADNDKNVSQKPSVLSGSDILSPEHSATMTSNQPHQTTSNTENANPSREVAEQSGVRFKIGSPRHFFSFRAGLFDTSIADCKRILLDPDCDSDIVGSWLLTEISHWDNERERIYILTKKNLYVIKYDFIALRILKNEKHPLNKFDTIQKGLLTYPPSSVVPKLEGITNGVGSILRGGIFKKSDGNVVKTQKDFIKQLPKKIDIHQFHSIERNEIGLRLKWNKGQPISTMTSWNPFATDIPWKTISNHPIFTYEDIYNSEPTIREDLTRTKSIYSVENLFQSLWGLINNPQPNIENSDINYDCKLDESPILLENYANFGAMVHNKNNLGFFKVRGKFSF